MSERPTEALRYAVNQHLHDRAHNASDTDKCRASAREVLTEYDALDATIDSLTAEVGRLRGLLGEAYEHLTTPTDVARFTPSEMMGLTDRIEAALTPPALATRSPLGKPFNPGIVIDNTPRSIQPPKIGEGSLPKPAPEDNLWRPCPDCKGKTACDCHLCWGRGRVPATGDER